jgi:hypothetical protein
MSVAFYFAMSFITVVSLKHTKLVAAFFHLHEPSNRLRHIGENELSSTACKGNNYITHSHNYFF